MQRKLHRVLYNYFSSYREMPSWTVLLKSTGKSKEQLIRFLDEMQSIGKLEWIDEEPKTIKLLQLPGQTKKLLMNGQQ